MKSKVLATIENILKINGIICAYDKNNQCIISYPAEKENINKALVKTGFISSLSSNVGVKGNTAIFNLISDDSTHKRKVAIDDVSDIFVALKKAVEKTGLPYQITTGTIFITFKLSVPLDVKFKLDTIRSLKYLIMKSGLDATLYTEDASDLFNEYLVKRNGLTVQISTHSTQEDAVILCNMCGSRLTQRGYNEL